MSSLDDDDLDTQAVSIEAVLAPIEGDHPAGDDVRLDASPSSVYFRLRDARAEARSEERQADNDPGAATGVPTQWSLIRKLTSEVLESKSKDVEIACWLTEALTRRDGLAGLALGADVLTGLISNFWDQGLYPSPEDDTPADRLVSITGMSGEDRDGSLLAPLRKIVLFARGDGTPVTIWEFERAREIVGLAATKPSKSERSGEPSFADLEADARGMGQASLHEIRRDAARADASWRALEDAVAKVAKDDAVPSTARVRNMIESVRRLVDRYLPDEPAEAIATAPDAAAAADGDGPLRAKSATIEHGLLSADTRDAMLGELLRIASLFRECEPNSPLSFTIEEAVRRARMAWPDLLRELITDDGARMGVLAVTGMRPAPPTRPTE